VRDYKNIDRIFQENLKDLEVFPPNKSWGIIEKNLVPVSIKKRLPFWLKFASVAALLILFFTIGTIYLIPENRFSKNFLKLKSNSNLLIDRNDSIDLIIAKKDLEIKILHTKLDSKKVLSEENEDIISKINEDNSNALLENTTLKKSSNSNSILADALNLPLSNKKKKKIENKEVSNSKITVATIFAPIYINSLGDGSGIDSQFKDSRASGNSSYSYGVKFAYQLNSKFSVQSGVNLISLGYTTNNVYVTPGVSVLGFSNLSTIPIASKSQNDIGAKQGGIILEDSNIGSLNQVFGYVEIPVELKYSVTDGKLGVNLVGGFSTLLLNKDEVFVETNSFTQSLGSSNNLREINFSGNLGVDVDYLINKNLFINISPMFKIQTNTFSKNSGSIQPFYLGVYTGLNYKF
tara:strand:+ start:1603 stop:2820 length:1218 start_codon:yes stop_codon:yes gene_type:complete